MKIQRIVYSSMFCFSITTHAALPTINSASEKHSANKITDETKSKTTSVTTHLKLTSISSNPAAVDFMTNKGALQRYLEKKYGIKNDHGINTLGVWIGDTNRLFSGGIPDVHRTTSNSLLLLNMSADTQKLYGWRDGLFGAQFLRLDAQSTNRQAGVVQGYNSIPGPPPLNRSELYEIWYRQKLFDEKLIVRIGKTIPTLDFNNVIKPVVLSQGSPTVPAVTGLIYTPIFINPTMLGVMPGYYNSAYGITTHFVPNKNWYISYGIYDGNLASRKQTGLTGPTFNGAYFQATETGANWLLGKNQLPGGVGVGMWNQKGLIVTTPTLTAKNATGAYLFGSQRLWYKYLGLDSSGISGFYQFGVNNSDVLLVKKYIGAGLTAFGMVAHRPDDSVGIGTAYSWLNQRIFGRASELMYQLYYQAKITNIVYLEPALSYIPTPGVSANLNPAWAGTVRVLALF